MGVNVKYTFTHHSCVILMKLEFLQKFLKNTQISNFMKICPVEVELFYADIRMDRLDDGQT